jgi:putative FmdB family regulatory protein
MPMYSYQCRECGFWLEELHKCGAWLTECPKCGGKLQREFRAPAIRTATRFESHYGTLADQFKGDTIALNYAVKQAKRFGYTPKPSDIYMRTLCRPGIGPGDPEAFIPAGSGEDYGKKLLRKRNWSCEDLGVEAVEAAPKPKVRLAPDLVEETRQRMLKQDPGLAVKDQRELREAIIDKHGRKT